MPNTPYLPGGAPLPNVEKEVAAVSGRFAGKRTLRTAEAATGAAILADLPGHPFVHFSCHGAVIPGKPEECGLYLADGRLTIRDISHRRLPRGAAQFAFLSACDTAAPSATLADEAITMAAAMQLAGFRHVIATMWHIADFTAPDVASEVYRVLLANRGDEENLPAALALHSGVRLLREQGVPPTWWAPYIHNGP
jgi:CHAT domain-containing protein